ncbi:hypothetical protein SAMN02745166_02511 [Prosthecobacter debontii]|uniref:Uncharacterized protein n=1 Tax=Prosthecobacter debontii TaxID=48467 RepID=A0A1T4Y6S1_9BACT|nr:hypothetical protein [Prosthecobacter debontii]SKA96991.1 hypothetical protein SAMN02745166_02511 [Prosthecobacter debontii]
MNLRRFYLVGLGLILVCLTGCDSGEVWRSGSYSVYWIDISTDLTLGRNLGGGSSIGRVMPQVFAVGEDADWIVAARHPESDRFTDEFFYFAKAEDGPYKNADEVVKGPFTRAQFEQLRKELGLPGWTKEF